ncbi:unnamed protein product [Closterium sp. NIES-65]|nr:unnamed protein product [Closterium sp. NIES-65]
MAATPITPRGVCASPSAFTQDARNPTAQASIPRESQHVTGIGNAGAPWLRQVAAPSASRRWVTLFAESPFAGGHAYGATVGCRIATSSHATDEYSRASANAVAWGTASTAIQEPPREEGDLKGEQLTQRKQLEIRKQGGSREQRGRQQKGRKGSEAQGRIDGRPADGRTVVLPDDRQHRVAHHTNGARQSGSRPQLVGRRAVIRAWSLALLTAAVASFDWVPGPAGSEARVAARAWDVGALFGGGWEGDKDPINPFTLYGTVQCVTGVSVIGNAVCGKGEGSERDGSCSVACDKACEGAMRRHGEVVLRSTGYTIEDADARKAVRQCSSQCMRECTKSGRFSSFELLDAYEKNRKEQLQTWAGIEAEMDGEVASGALSAQIKTRKAKTVIREVSRNGIISTGVKEVLTAATDHFREAFSCTGGGVVPGRTTHPVQRTLGDKSRLALSAPWSEADVRKAVKELAPRKSPGADGLPKELFDHNWDLLGPILMDLVRRFAERDELPHSVSTAVTILLHKKGEKSELGNYRPITLLSTVYKIIAKVMASRLKAVLHEVISEDQYGFIPGRQLADTVSVVADAIEAGANGKEDWYLMMIDFQKAFDSISRDYLFGTLRKLGLPEDFVGWTIGLHKEAGTCLHINGWTGDKVAVEKSVRQGCPLAPYLFLCAVEPLCQEISRAKLGIGKKGVGKLAYLGYADDTSLLLHGVEQLEAAAGVLSAFGEESGLKVNEGKTIIFPLGKNRGKTAPQNLNYKWADKDEPERLLEIWITPNGDPTPSWNKALDRAKGELAKWEMQHPTTSARVTIVNSYIVPIFLFQAQVYLPSEAIWKKIRKLCHTFISKGEAVEEKQFILWNYRLVCTPRKDGGLGLICPEKRVDSIAIRCVCKLVLKPNSVKKWLAEKAAEMPLDLDTIFAHRSLLDHWEKGSERWKELIGKFWVSPLCKPRAPTNRWEVEQEHLAFNPNIPFRGASPFGNQKGAEALLGIRMGDLIVKARDGTCELKKLAALARELGCREKAKWALRAFNAAPATWKEMVLAKLTSEEIVATVKLLRSSNGATGGFTYWKVGEARGDTVEGILCDIGDGGHFSPYEGNLKMYFNLRSGVPMFTEGSVFLGPMGDVRTKLLLSAACEGGELITLKGIRKVLADSTGPQDEQKRWEGQRRVIEWDRVIEQRDSLVTPRRAREILIRLHCRNLQVGSRLFFMGVVCHTARERKPQITASLTAWRCRGWRM